jgi:hypothetical protein
MKKLVTIEEDSNEGLMALIGRRVTFFCMNYIYTGDLVGLNDTCVKLDNPAIVYETGAFTTKDWKDSQALPNSIYLQCSAFEAFGEVK